MMVPKREGGRTPQPATVRHHQVGLNSTPYSALKRSWQGLGEVSVGFRLRGEILFTFPQPQREMIPGAVGHNYPEDHTAPRALEKPSPSYHRLHRRVKGESG